MTDPKNISCVLFDLDGTIIDSAPGIIRCFGIGLDAVGAPNPGEEFLRGRIIGPPLAYSYTHYCGLSEEKSDEAVAAYRREYTVRGYAESTVYSGIFELLDCLRAMGIPLGIATSKPEQMAVSIAKLHGFYDKFDTICGAKLSDKHSTKAELIARALGDIGVPADEKAFMVGDKSYDIDGAAKAGISSLGVTYGFGTREELAAAGAKNIIDSPKEAAEFFRGL
ncbi:MAG: HAD family hydrolase [Ruminococcaceae bacterium]|nr:HAD family hydrolase [Oscillospiraceae bacterium]